MRNRMVLLSSVVLAASIIGASSASRGNERPVEIKNGFTVASGSRLLGGTAFPIFDSRYLNGAKRGWNALLEVSGPAASTYDLYAKQARSNGYAPDWSGEACHNLSGQDVYCSGGADTATGRLRLELRVCAECNPPIALLSLTELSTGSHGAKIPGEPPAVDPVDQLALDADQKRESRTDLAMTPGEPLGASSTFRLVRGSVVSASGDLQGCVSGSNVALVSARTDVGDVFRRYAAQIPHETPIRRKSGTIDGRAAREARGDWGAVQMVERAGGTVLLVSECRD